MISIYQIKPLFQKVLRPIVRRLARWGVTANQVTVAAMILSFLTGGLLLLNPNQPRLLLLVPVVLFIRMALNAIDGMLAREHHMKTKLGNILNELGDVLSDAALYLPFAFMPYFSAPLIVGVVVLSIVSEMTGVLGVVIGGSRRYDGPMGKSDRAFLFGLISLLIPLGVPTAKWLSVLLVITIFLIIWNILNRIRRALQEVE